MVCWCTGRCGMRKRWNPALGLALAAALGLLANSCGSDREEGPLSPSSQFLSVTFSWSLVSATALRSGAVAPSTYRFEAAAKDGAIPYTFRWNCGDGSPEVDGNPVTHDFPGPGTYTVLVTVTDAAGSVVTSDPADGKVVVGCSGMTLACSANPTEGDSPLSVALEGMAQCGVEPVEYSWDFGDGARSAGPTTSHAYRVTSGKTRTFMAEISATDASGASATCSQTVRVTRPGPPPNKQPSVACDAHPEDIVGSQTAAISCIPTDPDGDDLTWSAVLTNGGGGSLNPTVGGPVSSGQWFHILFHGANPTVATITTTVEDPGGLTATSVTAVTVTANSPPTLSCPSACPGIGSCTCSASDPDANLGLWSVSACTPPSPSAGLFANPAGEDFSWDALGLCDHTVTVTDDEGATASAVVRILI